MNKQLLRYLKPMQRALVITVSTGVLGTVATIAQMAWLSSVVSRVFLFHASLMQVLPELSLLLGAVVVRALLTHWREVVAQSGAMRAKAELREQLFAQIFRLGPGYCKYESTGELVATASDGIERLDAYVSRYLPQIYLSVLVPLLIAVYIFPRDWSSAILLLVTGPVIPLLMIMVGSYAEKRIQSQWSALSRMSAHFLDVVQGLTTLKLFGRSSAENSQVTRVSNEVREKTMQALRIAFLSGMVLEFMVSVAIGLVAVTLGIRLLNNTIAFDQAFLILLLTPEFYRPLRELGTQRHAGMEGEAAAKRIVEILETPLPVQSGDTASDFAPEQLTITLSGVGYTYPTNQKWSSDVASNSERPALQDINLTLLPASITALVGPSGAGKSTLVNLLLRFIDTQEGEITVNGLVLKNLAVETWYRYVALVPQRPYLCAGSIRDNIRMARTDASEQEVEGAARLAGATEFIQRLSQGFEIEIGEQGLRLSAGQAQRLAIARAFLKNAPLLILDEPTSNLDPLSEKLIQQALEQLMQNKTVLVIAHRYNTIKHARQIVHLQDGRLLKISQAVELLSESGVEQRKGMLVQ